MGVQECFLSQNPGFSTSTAIPLHAEVSGGTLQGNRFLPFHRYQGLGSIHPHQLVLQSKTKNHRQESWLSS